MESNKNKNQQKSYWKEEDGRGHICFKKTLQQ